MSIPAARLVFGDEDRAAVLAMVDESLRTGSLTLGRRTEELEQAFAARHGVPFAVAVSSGTAALEIILHILGIDGREVVVPSNTFFATAAAVLRAGGIPRFADVSPQTMALTAATVEAALTERTAAVVDVHIGGLVAPDVEGIAALCRARGIELVEDAAHAHGASWRDRAAGSFGIAGAFSFYPTKVMTAGEGGMIVTSDERVRDEARIYRDQGKAGFLGGDHVRMGYAWRLSEIHAAVAVVQLRRLDEFISTRRRVAAIYDEALAGAGWIAPLGAPDGSMSNYYKYIALLAPGLERDALKSRLREAGVSLSGEVYARPLHRQPVFDRLAAPALPVTDDVCARHVCLPIHSDMTDAEAAFVVDRVLESAPVAAREA
ncbi:MAG TPA: DegT/DnrJ/EryC1/StrS family aminotransferase [Acidimicrobiales bacterium]|nr:DegT/DnrJ/EryC1/StrS family aminotransferase [Acidimicrobiales bacterium]